ncbi:MAG: beta-mannanase [Planctomycetota bacterium]
MFTEPGTFVIGCNYWASHAGTAMWSDWRPKVVAADLRRLSRAGLEVLRVFPLWPDFQPLVLLRGGGGSPVEYRHGEEPLADDAAGRAGMSAVAFGRFAVFLDLAARNRLKVVVGLITGWMSGRLFVPPALEGLNVIHDPAALKWEVRFVRHFVTRFKGHAAITAWDLGNECNCMGGNPAEGWSWTALIANTIKAVDPVRPVISGMHSLTPDDRGRSPLWTIEGQAENTDVLTVHPYPVFTPHCDRDPINTMRPGLHAAAEACLYADVGGKPCLGEEVGTLGLSIASETVAADYIRMVLYSLWVHDHRGLLWWCAHDQDHLAHAPYNWCTVERELGLFRADNTPRPVLRELAAFRKFRDGLPLAALPPRRTEAVCILSDGQDHWGAGFDLVFRHETQPLPDAELYLLPGITGHRIMVRRRWLALFARVRAGATLYLSHDDGILSGFEGLTGLRVETRERRHASGRAGFDLPGTPVLPVDGAFRPALSEAGAKVIGRETDGNPVFASHAYGRGRVFFLAFPMEKNLITGAGTVHAPDAPPFWHIYRMVADAVIGRRIVRKVEPQVGLTEHPLGKRTAVVTAINYSPRPVATTLAIASGWRLGRVHRGKLRSGTAGTSLVLPGNDAAVFEVRK